MRFVLRSLELLAVGLFTCVMTLHGVSRLLARQVLDGVVEVAFALALLALWRFLYRWLQAQEDAVARGIARALTDAVVCAYRVERRHGQWGLHNPPISAAQKRSTFLGLPEKLTGTGRLQGDSATKE